MNQLQIYSDIFRRALFFCFCLLVFSTKTMAQDIPEVEQYELKSYSPINYGLKDLTFEARIKNLKEVLEGKYNFSNLIDVYYKVYWIFPGQYQMSVEGLPDGFNELELELKSILKEKLEFVVPKGISSKLRAYKLSYKSKKPTVIEGIDPTQSRTANRIELEFSGDGKLEEFRSFSPYNVTKSILELSSKSWSHNKWVIESYKVVSETPQSLTSVTNLIEYETHSGIGLPKSVKTRTKVEAKGKEKNTTLSEEGSELTFSNYEVNTGKAKKAMVQK